MWIQCRQVQQLKPMLTLKREIGSGKKVLAAPRGKEPENLDKQNLGRHLRESLLIKRAFIMSKGANTSARKIKPFGGQTRPPRMISLDH